MRIASILQTKGSLVVTIDGSITILEASRELARYGIGAIVVADDGQHIDGILSERDVARAIATFGPAALEQPVSAVMTSDVTTCAPSDTTDELAVVMTAQRIRHLPVVDGEKLVGIVSIGDIVKYRLDELQTETQTLHDYLYSGR